MAVAAKSESMTGNVLMEPECRYLYIVPDSEAADRDALLPFEGDRMLSIVLSKALLVVDDDKIADQIITWQIGDQIRA